VEEPESHLHPAAQVKLVEVFARLAREGLNMLITTHSDILLRKLAHLVMEGSAEGGASAPGACPASLSSPSTLKYSCLDASS